MRIIMIIYFAFISMFTHGQNQGSLNLKFHGVYETDCEYEEDDDEGTQSYLRFYSNGKVISVSTDCEGTASDLKDWFNIYHKYVGIGDYVIKGFRIQFDATSNSGTVEYRGRIDKNGLILLKSKSLINGYRSKEKYKFVQVDGIK